MILNLEERVKKRMSKKIDFLVKQRQKDYDTFIKSSKYGTIIIVFIVAVVVIGVIAP